tara:strand:+ start:35 stop:250 length:216 start_codon:yes stop_codon:yes gene_type:complete
MDVAGAAVYRRRSIAAKMAIAHRGWQEAMPKPMVKGIAMHEKTRSFFTKKLLACIVRSDRQKGKPTGDVYW